MAGELSREEIERLQSRLRSEGVCMTCVLRAPAPDGCSDCLNTGYERGEVARLAVAKAEGVREGVEACAVWLETRAAAFLDTRDQHMREAAKGSLASAELHSRRACSAEATAALLSEAAAELRRFSPPLAEPTDMTADWTVADTELARDILSYLGIGSDVSLEPGDRRRDHIAAMIYADRERRTRPTEPTQTDDGWIEWKGGKCPVPADTLVEWRLRHETENNYTLVVRPAGDLYWSHESPPPALDIVAYRIVKLAESSDGWIEWKGGECPVQDGVEIYAKMRDGVICRSLEPRGWCGWQHDPRAPALDIVAYRIIKPTKPSAPVKEDE